MKHDKLLVREARIRTGCFSFNFDPDVEPTLVCPLCVLDGNRQSDERTAAYSRSGHILCLSNQGGCGRYSAILLRTLRQGEVPVIPVAFLRDPWTLETQTVAIARLRPALEGSGDLLDLLSMDTVQPEVVVGLKLPKLLMEGRFGGFSRLLGEQHRMAVGVG